MTQHIKVQDGVIIYSTSSPTTPVVQPNPTPTGDVDFIINGQLSVSTKVSLGNGPLVNGLLSSPPNTNMVLESGSDLSLQSPNGVISLNDVAWPDGTVTPVPGMYLGVSSTNTLQFYTLPGGSGLQMNVFIMSGGTGDFSGILVNNWGSVTRRDEGTQLWSYQTLDSSYQCLVPGVYEIIVECQIVGNDGASPFPTWPDSMSAFGVNLIGSLGATVRTPETKSHVRYSAPGAFPNGAGNSAIAAFAPTEAALSATISSFTERYIVTAEVGGKVFPALFAYSYNLGGSVTSTCDMSISFMKVSNYTPI